MSLSFCKNEINTNSELPRIVIQQVYASPREENNLVNISLFPEFKDKSRLYMQRPNRRAVFSFNGLTGHVTQGEPCGQEPNKFA